MFKKMTIVLISFLFVIASVNGAFAFKPKVKVKNKPSVITKVSPIKKVIPNLSELTAKKWKNPKHVTSSEGKGYGSHKKDGSIDHRTLKGNDRTRAQKEGDAKRRGPRS